MHVRQHAWICARTSLKQRLALELSRHLAIATTGSCCGTDTEVFNLGL